MKTIKNTILFSLAFAMQLSFTMGEAEASVRKSFAQSTQTIPAIANEPHNGKRSRDFMADLWTNQIIIQHKVEDKQLQDALSIENNNLLRDAITINCLKKD